MIKGEGVEEGKRWGSQEQVGEFRVELELEKAMATHSSTLAWKISGTEEPGGLQSMGSQRVHMTERLAQI